ncbi:MAG: glycosyltransferase [Bacteroidales bacterium]|nr:glycosyltransferase [Bacteroidales bacterium]
MGDKINNNQEYLLFTSSNFPTGGAGAAFLNLFCKGMMSHGCPVKVYLTRGFAFKSNVERILRKNKTSDGIAYSYLGLTKRPGKGIFKPIDDFLSFFHLLFFLPSIAWKKKRTIIFVYQADFFHSMLLYLTKKLFGIRIITFVPEYFNKANFQSLVNKIQYNTFIFTLKHLNPLSDGLIVFSHFLKDIYLSKGVKEDRIFVQPNLTDFEFWNAPRTTEKYTIGYSGTPGAKDGLTYMFSALSLLKDQMPVSLIVVGDSPFGKSMIPEMEIACENLGIRSLVRFAGLVEYDEVRTYLSQCKLLAITRPKNIQTQAGFPTKLGEYMALKKPVLATDFGEVERYFTDGSDVVIAKCGDPVSIAEKIKWMLQNEEKVNSIAVNGFHKAHELLEYNLSMTRIIAYLDKL